MNESKSRSSRRALRGASAIGVLMLGAVLGGACSSSSVSPGRDAQVATDAGGNDVRAEAGGQEGSAEAVAQPLPEASAQDASAEAGSDAASIPDADCKDTSAGPYCWIACPRSVTDFCTLWAKYKGVCVTDWPADPASFCSVYTPARGTDFLAVATCGGYLALEANGTDGGVDFYYDQATGKLVAMVSHDYVSGTARCQGGPSGFVEPSCSFQQIACGDAGGAAGAGGSGGASNAGAGGASAGGADGGM